MIVSIQPGKATGTLAVPPSKSMAHRLLICAGLSAGESCISGIDFNEDILATIDCLCALGASCVIKDGTVTVSGIGHYAFEPSKVLNCRESGSTLRFFIPLALLRGKEVSFTGTTKLLSRPLDVYKQMCSEKQFLFEQDSNRLKVKGTLSGGEYVIPGDISSQFVTGLLFALPLADRDSKLTLIPPIESRGYIALTLQALKSFGIEAFWLDQKTISIPGNQRYLPCSLSVEGDYSGSAFFAALNALGSDISIEGLKCDSLQGDKIYEEYIPKLCEGFTTLHLADCPDLGPVLFALAAAKYGARFTGTKRLKIKESDRAAAMAEELSAFGADVRVLDDEVIIYPAAFHPPSTILKGHNDHRIVMSLAVLLTLTGGMIEGAEAVRKSFPDFFAKLQSLGVEVSFYESDK